MDWQDVQDCWGCQGQVYFNRILWGKFRRILRSNCFFNNSKLNVVQASQREPVYITWNLREDTGALNTGKPVLQILANDYGVNFRFTSNNYLVTHLWGKLILESSYRADIIEKSNIANGKFRGSCPYQPTIHQLELGKLLVLQVPLLNFHRF